MVKLKMKRIAMIPLAVLFICVLLLPVSVYASEGVPNVELYDGLLEKSGAGELYGSLNAESRELLKEAGIDTFSVDGSFDTDSFLSMVSGVLNDKLSLPLKTVAAVLIIIIICKLASCFDNTNISSTANLVGAIAAAGAVLAPVIALIESAKSVIQGASAFLVSCVPVYSALMIAAGNTTSGASYSYTALAAGNLIPFISTTFIIPMLNIFLAFAVTSAVSSVQLDKVTDSIYRFIKWLLVLLVTVFTGVISAQTFLNGNIDAVSAKTVKAVTSSLVPVVGGVIGDSLAAIQGSVQIVKSGVGAFGIIASMIIFLPAILEAVLWTLICSICEIAADLFEVPQIGKFMGISMSVAKMILALLVSALLVCLVCGSIVIFTKGAL